MATPHGIRIAEIITRIVQVIEVPRSLLADFLAMEQSSKMGFYVLVAGRNYRKRSRVITRSAEKFSPGSMPEWFENHSPQTCSASSGRIQSRWGSRLGAGWPVLLASHASTRNAITSLPCCFRVVVTVRRRLWQSAPLWDWTP